MSLDHDMKIAEMQQKENKRTALINSVKARVNPLQACSWTSS